MTTEARCRLDGSSVRLNQCCSEYLELNGTILSRVLLILVWMDPYFIGRYIYLSPHIQPSYI
ncbi:hypothetical protein BJX96DRAFT_144762 [Aspergillus floccosus]